eukprot:UN27880
MKKLQEIKMKRTRKNEEKKNDRIEIQNVKRVPNPAKDIRARIQRGRSAETRIVNASSEFDSSIQHHLDTHIRLEEAEKKVQQETFEFIKEQKEIRENLLSNIREKNLLNDIPKISPRRKKTPQPKINNVNNVSNLNINTQRDSSFSKSVDGFSSPTQRLSVRIQKRISELRQQRNEIDNHAKKSRKSTTNLNDMLQPMIQPINLSSSTSSIPSIPSRQVKFHDSNDKSISSIGTLERSVQNRTLGQSQSTGMLTQISMLTSLSQSQKPPLAPESTLFRDYSRHSLKNTSVDNKKVLKALSTSDESTIGDLSSVLTQSLQESIYKFRTDFKKENNDLILPKTLGVNLNESTRRESLQHNELDYMDIRMHVNPEKSSQNDVNKTLTGSSTILMNESGLDTICVRASPQLDENEIQQKGDKIKENDTKKVDKIKENDKSAHINKPSDSITLKDQISQDSIQTKSAAARRLANVLNAEVNAKTDPTKE